MKTKCLLCTAVVETGHGFYDHLEDVHMMPIRRQRIIQPENWIHGMSLEKRIKKLEVLAKVNMVINAEERISKLESIIVTEMINENKKPT